MNFVYGMMAACSAEIRHGSKRHGEFSGVGGPCVFAEITRAYVTLHRIGG